VAGVVADGPLRDVDEAVACEFPVFSRTLTSRTARGRVVELGVQVPLTLGGAREEVIVEPGDYVLADRSAVIFIAAADIERVLDAAETIVAKEAAMAKAILSGTPSAKSWAEITNTCWSNRHHAHPRRHPGHERGARRPARHRHPQRCAGQGRHRRPVLQDQNRATSDFRMAGRAWTLLYGPAANPPGTVGDYIDDVPSGSVIVLDNGGRDNATVWG
jgi:regulator of RNase E activity RraA